MNENPGETPNPLNPSPNLGADPGAMAMSAGPIQEPQPITSPTPQPASQPVQPVQPTPQAQATETVAVETVESLDPAGRPMEKVAPVEAPKKKSKMGLIVGIVVAAVVLIGAGVAAAIVAMNMNKSDAVAAAMAKIMQGETPKNVAVDGSIDILLNDPSLPISRVNIDLDSDIVTGSAINTSSAVLTLTTRNNGDYSVKFNEVYATNGDLYFKLDGATELIEDSGLVEYFLGSGETVVDCAAADEDCIAEENITAGAGPTYSNIITDAIELIDGEWLRISVDELGSYGGEFVSNSNVSCVTNLVSDVSKSSNSTFDLYNKYPFIASSNDGVIIASRGNPVYRVSIDSEKFANFINSIQNASLASDVYDCLGWSDNVAVDAADVQEVVELMPTVYTEINGNNDFARLYLETDISDGMASVVIDLNFVYPTNVNISEPVEYTDFSDIIQEIMLSMFQIPEVEIDTESVTVDN